MYRSNAHDDRIHRFSSILGMDEAKLREFMERHVSEDNINEFGLFDNLKMTVDNSKAKEYFERIEGKEIKPFRVPAKVDKLLRKFILDGAFDVD